MDNNKRMYYEKFELYFVSYIVRLIPVLLICFHVKRILSGRVKVKRNSFSTKINTYQHHEQKGRGVNVFSVFLVSYRSQNCQDKNKFYSSISDKVLRNNSQERGNLSQSSRSTCRMKVFNLTGFFFPLG